MFERDREIVLPLSGSRRARIVGDHRRTALRECRLRADRANDKRAAIALNWSHVQMSLPTSARSVNQKLQCVRHNRRPAGRLRRAMARAAAETAPSANKSGASSDRSPSFARRVRSSMFERRSVCPAFLLSRSSLCHRRTTRTRAASHHRTRSRRFRRQSDAVVTTLPVSVSSIVIILL